VNEAFPSTMLRDGFPLERMTPHTRHRINSIRQERVLTDGSGWSVFKRVFEPDELLAELGPGRILHAGRWFVTVAAGSRN